MRTYDYLKEKYGEEYKQELEKCANEVTEISIHPDTLYRLEEEMIKRGDEIQSLCLKISDEDIESRLYRFIVETKRKNFLFLIVSGLRAPRILSRLNDITSIEDIEIQLAMDRKVQKPFVNEIVAIAY